METLKKPEEWQKEFGFTVIDPDGWSNSGISWEKPISKEHFEQLASLSTIRFNK